MNLENITLCVPHKMWNGGRGLGFILNLWYRADLGINAQRPISMEKSSISTHCLFLWHTLFKRVYIREEIICKGLRVTKRNKMWQQRLDYNAIRCHGNSYLSGIALSSATSNLMRWESGEEHITRVKFAETTVATLQENWVRILIRWTPK